MKRAVSGENEVSLHVWGVGRGRDCDSLKAFVKVLQRSTCVVRFASPWNAVGAGVGWRMKVLVLNRKLAWAFHKQEQ